MGKDFVELSMDETIECEGGGIGIMLLCPDGALEHRPGHLHNPTRQPRAHA